MFLAVFLSNFVSALVMQASIPQKNSSQNAGAVQIHCTDDVEPRHRFEYWVDMICATYVSLESEPCDSLECFGEVRSLSLRSADISIVRSNVPLVRRTTTQIDDSTDEYILVHLCHSGSALISQHNRIAHLEPGDFAIYQSIDPYELAFATHCDTQVLKVPRSALAAHVKSIENLTARKISGHSCEGSLLHTMMSGMCSRLDKISGTTGQKIGEALISTVAAGLQSLPEAQIRVRTGLDAYYLARAKSYIQQNLRKESLDAAEVARAVGISSRHLARVFQEEPMSPSRMIWFQRLESCKRDLAGSYLYANNISQIAFAWGFNNASHFSKAFREQFGMSPKDWQGLNKRAAQS